MDFEFLSREEYSTTVNSQELGSLGRLAVFRFQIIRAFNKAGLGWPMKIVGGNRSRIPVPLAVGLSTVMSARNNSRARIVYANAADPV